MKNKKILIPILSFVIISLILIFLFSGNSPEKIAAKNRKARFEFNYEEYLKTYPEFTLTKFKKEADVSENASIEETAKKLKEGISAEIDVKILKTKTMKKEEVDDYTLYNDLKEEYQEMTTDDFQKISQSAVVRVDYERISKDRTWVESDELLCVKMGTKWYVMLELSTSSED
ncbi:MAG: hypothetical protein Q4B40_06115 [Clostridia bacterium]|nr:hypothetical protein [Clostridia bacterium]